jgi:hypothetical protein
VISLFATALFATSGLATAAAAPLASEARFELLFATAALVAVVPVGLSRPWRVGAIPGRKDIRRTVGDQNRLRGAADAFLRCLPDLHHGE